MIPYRRKHPTLWCPLLFAMGFIFIIILRAVTGTSLAAIPANLQKHDTYFVVAHLHKPLIAGAVFPLLGAFYYWLPKINGCPLKQSLGHLNFWLFFIGYNLTFFPMGALGPSGARPGVNPQPTRMGWETSSVVSTVGAILMGFGVLVFFTNVFISRATKKN